MKRALFIGAAALFIGGAFAFNVNNSMKTSASDCGTCDKTKCTQSASTCCGSGICIPGCCK